MIFEMQRLIFNVILLVRFSRLANNSHNDTIAMIKKIEN